MKKIMKMNISKFDYKKHKFKKKMIYEYIKRFIDIITSLCTILLLSWLFIIIAIIIKLTSKGKILFKDKRVGKNGKQIIVLKYRTMHEDAEQKIEKYLTKEQLLQWKKDRKIDNDPRITKVGKFLRKTSLDEIPQILNVLTGRLSMIGNRPISQMEYERWYTEEEKDLLYKIKPGITGYWQAYGRSDVTFESGERQKLDLIYIFKRSIWMDIKIIFKTIFTVLLGKGVQ